MTNPFDYGPPPDSGGYRSPAAGRSGAAPPGVPVATTPHAPGPVAGGIFGSPTTTTVVEPRGGRSSIGWLFAGLVMGCAALIVALLLGGTIAVAVAAWVVAGTGVVGVLALHVRADAAERARPFAVLPPTSVRVLYWLVVGLAVAGVAVSAWRIAEWAGRL